MLKRKIGIVADDSVWIDRSPFTDTLEQALHIVVGGCEFLKLQICWVKRISAAPEPRRYLSIRIPIPERQIELRIAGEFAYDLLESANIFTVPGKKEPVRMCTIIPMNFRLPVPTPAISGGQIHHRGHSFAVRLQYFVVCGQFRQVTPFANLRVYFAGLLERNDCRGRGTATQRLSPRQHFASPGALLMIATGAYDNVYHRFCPTVQSGHTRRGRAP